jgi:hypothetical protein
MTKLSSPNKNRVAKRANRIFKDEFGLDQIFENNKALNEQVH